MHHIKSFDYFIKDFLIFAKLLQKMRSLIGTLFDEDEIKEKTKFQDMKAKDDKGHMRWQGAFTGGFTAGYKNTCGSKQGWAPSTFVSSRSKRAERVTQDIHSFMDSQDLGKGQLSQNINLQSGFVTSSGANPFNIVVKESIGEQILNRLRKAKATEQQPRDEEDVHKLFEKYAKEEELESTGKQARTTHFKEKTDFVSVNGALFDQEEDPFISEFEDLFHQLIRGNVKEETEEEKKQKKQANRISFDYTKPLDEDYQNDYLSEIVEHQLGDDRPNKKVKLDLFKHHLEELYTKFEQSKQNERNIQIPIVPEDYNPYKKMQQLAAKQKLLQPAAVQQPQKRLTAQDRRQALGQHKPDLKSRVQNQKFIKGQTQEFGCHDQLEYYLMNPEKQKRYQSYVLEMEGKIVGGDNGLDWREADKQRVEFQKIYKKAQEKGIATKAKTLQIQHNKKLQNQPLDRIVRTKSAWRPHRLLCKRFGVLTPYAIEKDDSDFQ